ncbi:MAG: NAD(P)H-dependent flavin oxidoreductase [Cytophaga sp.]|uniref:NAD(P)H-dependent flavin oxidoreductase n=1 Tax=Cytophaga sp. TaxID=29535 RepID=UPI003F7DB85B
MQTTITQLFNTQYPIIQAGMVWCSGWRLAAAVSNAGGLGLIGAGSMSADLLREHIQKCKAATDKPFGVNLPLLYTHIDQQIQVLLDEKIRIVFTSAGNPVTYTSKLKAAGMTVVHVVSSTKFALKAQQAGVDAVVAEGFEAGGHNGREETTTMCLIPAVAAAVNIPVIAAGGIGSGRAMLAAFALGASGVQVGSAFAVSAESSAHELFKKRVIETTEGDTILTLKKLTPVRLIKNAFYEQVQQAEAACASAEELKTILSKGRSKKGIFEGDLNEGELEIGQVSAQLSSIKSAAEIVKDIMNEFEAVKKKIQ